MFSISSVIFLFYRNNRITVKNGNEVIPYDEFSQLKEKTDFRGSDRTDLMRFHAAFSGHNRYRIEGIPSCS